MKKDFNEFRFAGLNCRDFSNKYYTMNRVSEDNNKIVVRVAGCHLKQTKFGYALILDRTHVVFIKDWQVDMNYFGNEVILTREFFNVKQWGEFDEFDDSDENLTFDAWVKIAKDQDNLVDEDGFQKTAVKWSK